MMLAISYQTKKRDQYLQDFKQKATNYFRMENVKDSTLLVVVVHIIR